MRLHRRAVLAAVGIGAIGAAAAGAVGTRLALSAGVGGPMAGQWTPLGELEWRQATSGWLGVANQHRPRIDQSFAAQPLTIDGQVFTKGIGSYPLSELTYRLDGRFSRLSAAVGIDDATPPGPNGARFLVFVDDVLRFESGTMRRGQPPRPIDFALNGATTLRLVAVDVREDEGLLFVDWVDPMLLRPLAGTPIADALWERRVRVDLSQRTSARARAERDLADRGQGYLAALEPTLGPRDDPTVRVGQDAAAGWVALGNRHLIAAIGLDGAWRGQILAIDRRTRRVVLDRVSPAVDLGDAAGTTIQLHAGAQSGRHTAQPTDEAPFGRGWTVTARFPLGAERGDATVELSLFDDRPYLVYTLRHQPLGETFAATRQQRDAASDPATRFVLLDGTAALGASPQYLTDFSRLRHASIHDDGIARRESVGPGKPIYVWDEPTDRGTLLAALDESRGPTELSVQRSPGEAAGRLRLSTGPRRDGSGSPRLYLEVTPTVDLRTSHASWRRISAALHPPADLPAWVKYQWITWYAFNVDIDEATIRRQIDTIADHLADLGPWHILIDAGWYVAEGRPGADWRNVDAAKFPSGLRALVDYAHQRGVRVMGYVSVPYLDTRARPGDWLGLGDLIAAHPDWLVALGGDETHQSYAFDFTRPAVRDYWRSVIHDLLIAYDMDAIKVDGLGNAEGAELSPQAVDAFGRVDAVADQTMDIYRFFHAEATRLKPDVYIQAGWMTPTLANPYCHAFWYGDDFPAFSNPYPFPGLREKVDYAVVAHRQLGQRSNMGNVYDPPNGSTINLWWLGAGLALGTQVALSFDLTQLTPASLGTYRALLAHDDAFAGETRFGPGLYPDYFATTVAGTTRLGIMNRAESARTIVARLADLGLDVTATHAAYDVEANRFLRVQGDLPVWIDGRSFRLYILRREPGVLWTTSAVALRRTSAGLDITVSGPAALARGRLDLACPEPRAVRIDGEPAARRGIAEPRSRGYRYDPAAGTLHLRYDHRTRHHIAVDL